MLQSLQMLSQIRSTSCPWYATSDIMTFDGTFFRSMSSAYSRRQTTALLEIERIYGWNVQPLGTNFGKVLSNPLPVVESETRISELRNNADDNSKQDLIVAQGTKLSWDTLHTSIMMREVRITSNIFHYRFFGAMWHFELEECVSNVRLRR